MDLLFPFCSLVEDADLFDLLAEGKVMRI